MPRAWTIDAVYHFVTDQAGVGNAFQHQRFYTLFRLFDRATEAYRILANYGRAVDQNGGGAWSSPKHPEGELKTTNFMMKAATKLLAAGYRRRPYRPPGQHIIWMPDPDSFQGPYIYATLNSMPLEPEPGDAQAVPAPADLSDAVSTKFVWLRTEQVEGGIMYFHTVSGDGWFIPFKDDAVDFRLSSEILARPPPIEHGMALARCEIRPLTAGGFMSPCWKCWSTTRRPSSRIAAGPVSSAFPDPPKATSAQCIGGFPFGAISSHVQPAPPRPTGDQTMYRSWIIDAIYLYVTDQAGAGNTFTKQRYYVYFRLIGVCAE